MTSQASSRLFHILYKKAVTTTPSATTIAVAVIISAFVVVITLFVATWFFYRRRRQQGSLSSPKVVYQSLQTHPQSVPSNSDQSTKYQSISVSEFSSHRSSVGSSRTYTQTFSLGHDLEAQLRGPSLQQDFMSDVPLSPKPSLARRQPQLDDQTHMANFLNPAVVQSSTSLTSQYSIVPPRSDLRPTLKVDIPSRSPSNRTLNYHSSMEYSLLISQELLAMLDSEVAPPPEVPRKSSRRKSVLVKSSNQERATIENNEADLSERLITPLSRMQSIQCR